MQYINIRPSNYRRWLRHSSEEHLGKCTFSSMQLDLFYNS